MGWFIWAIKWIKVSRFDLIKINSNLRTWVRNSIPLCFYIISCLSFIYFSICVIYSPRERKWRRVLKKAKGYPICFGFWGKNFISLKNYSINGNVHREREMSNNAERMKRWREKKVAIFIQSYWSWVLARKKLLRLIQVAYETSIIPIGD